MSFNFLASAPRGLADLLLRELEALGVADARERGAGVTFGGDLETAYRVCLNSRLASRVYVELAHFDAAAADEIYAAIRDIDWTRHLARGATLACEWSGRHPAITNTQYGALRIKDAVCDRLRAATGERPDVRPDRPSVRLHAHASGTRVTLSLDLAGEGLHRRGYRREAGEAPLRENLAAGILLRAGWPELAREGAEFLDPLCGSGTIVIEAALIALDRAPGLTRDYFGFLGWAGHDAGAWERVRGVAEERAQTGATNACLLRGSDRDGRVLEVARANARLAGLADRVSFERQSLADVRPATQKPGLLVTNPPYGVRLEDRGAAREVHRELGRLLREHFDGWRAAVLTGAPDLGLEIGLRAYRTHALWNGPLECRLLRFAVSAATHRDLRPAARTGTKIDASLADSAGSRMFANRLRKNRQRLERWARREQVSCYRLYDADMPEYSFAIDRYGSADADLAWLYVQEYAAPQAIDEQSARRRRDEALAALPQSTDVPAERIHLRTRRRTTRDTQYRKQGDAGEFHAVAEGGLRFLVNFKDYLDTGLFLDHRLTRARLRAAAQGARFLNLFGYTGSATIYAAAGGARATTTVDLSRTYLDWAQRNLALNGFRGTEHDLIQADCRAWLGEAERRQASFDLVFLDPPTFSNSKRMDGVLDIARDHAALIDACMRLVTAGGLLVFSTNAQRFQLDPALAVRYTVEDISRATLPFDFERNPRIHRVFEIRPRSGAGE
ncbi:MAG: bifunctional 23S rRNA (guanine(2069)-N(7))-methyltransferase RlmK/23S rRNA (guanine(2445)-N(2))-methyltransferase RlmL [Steroidobacteraceae bacterium]